MQVVCIGQKCAKNESLISCAIILITRRILDIWNGDKVFQRQGIWIYKRAGWKLLFYSSFKSQWRNHREWLLCVFRVENGYKGKDEAVDITVIEATERSIGC